MCSWLRNDGCESKLLCPVILGIIHCYFVKVNYIKNSCLMMNLVKMSFNEMLSISRTDSWVYADYLIISLAFLFHSSCTTERELFHCIFVLYPVQMQVQSSKSTGEQWITSPHWPCACRSSLFLPGYLGVASPDWRQVARDCLRSGQAGEDVDVPKCPLQPKRPQLESSGGSSTRKWRVSQSKKLL